jgi:hypothetical protein
MWCRAHSIICCYAATDVVCSMLHSPALSCVVHSTQHHLLLCCNWLWLLYAAQSCIKPSGAEQTASFVATQQLMLSALRCAVLHYAEWCRADGTISHYAVLQLWVGSAVRCTLHAISETLTASKTENSSWSSVSQMWPVSISKWCHHAGLQLQTCAPGHQRFCTLTI